MWWERWGVQPGLCHRARQGTHRRAPAPPHLCLSPLLLPASNKQTKISTICFPLPEEAGPARETEIRNPSFTELRAPGSANPPEKASWLSQPVDTRAQPRPAAALGAAEMCWGTWREAPGKHNLSSLINGQEASELVPRKKKIVTNNIFTKHEGPRGAAPVLE